MSDFNELTAGQKWYVVHTYTGYENKVKSTIERVVENRNLSHLIFDVKIPVETIVEQNGEEVKEKESKLFPCYVLVKMIMTEESWHAVRNITGVTGFVGPGSHPTPLTEEEVTSLNVETTSVQLAFGIGDMVVINKGFYNFIKVKASAGGKMCSFFKRTVLHDFYVADMHKADSVHGGICVDLHPCCLFQKEDRRFSGGVIYDCNRYSEYFRG